MTSRLSKLIGAARRSVQLHGGGISGTLAVAVRALKAIRALGINGFVMRVKAAGGRQEPARPVFEKHEFHSPVPPAQLQLKVGLMVHVFYADLIEEFAQSLQHMPVSYDLLVSVVDDTTRRQASDRFSRLPNVNHLELQIVPNRGRDIAPFLVAFREQILALDVIGHLHTKKSLYTGREQDTWRRYLLSSLLGSRERIAWILGMFQANPRLGILYPESHAGMPLWAHTWLSNFGACRELAQRLGFDISPTDYIDFPAGSMLWARVDALRPLYSLGLELKDFPVEHGQIDGTLHHAIERMFAVAAHRHNYCYGILPADGTLALSSEGERNWQAALDMPISSRMTLSAIEAKLISLDVFDTLVLRPFLFHTGARAYLAHLVADRLGLETFAEYRELAESKARHNLGKDVDLPGIYHTLAGLSGADKFPIDLLQSMEIEVEERLLRPRKGVIEAAQTLKRRGIRMVALSDMYLDSKTLKNILPSDVAALPDAWYVSCETGWRKDDDSAWNRLPGIENITQARWLHIGDNEHADVQRPLNHNLLTPVHVLRPSALLEVVPALRPLRPAQGAATRWQDQLWLGLLANRFADLVDRQPELLIPRPTLSPAQLGYVVLGPLVFDYLTWLVRLAQQHKVETILFLSREGYLLEQGFQQLQQCCPALSHLQGNYLLASRRGTGTPSLNVFDDLAQLLDSTYTGPLHGLIHARLGRRAAELLESRLGSAVMQGDVYLPEMRDELLRLLLPASDELLTLAAIERQAYLEYWKTMTHGSNTMVADIGYSGSIQANLARLTGQPLGGAYFALNYRASKVGSDSWAAARYFDGRSDGDPGQSAILRHDLLLETLLTAPSAQFAYFAAGVEGPIPRYADAEHSQSQWSTIAQVHEGALSFIRDVCNVAQEESHLLEFDRKSIQVPLTCIGSGCWDAPWLASLQLDDQFTGRGAVAAG
ncbi:rhamnan synthesis F family protein [Xanthomonas campestris]|uniref:rhamnan synthesis F family protein n=1 Tax=Xanthomonas TaxID=338 RepID=UPI001E33F28F|nr:rhamnan synthesis F family protein [Xanthomonas campestris]MCC5087635.1 polysaccharide biosynthesis protein [Xanthomonas campestris]